MLVGLWFRTTSTRDGRADENHLKTLYQEQGPQHGLLCTERMGSMTISIPDDLARGLEGMAAAQKKSIEQVAVESLRALFDRPTSPAALLAMIHTLPHPSRGAVDDLDRAIAEGRMPVRDQEIFDR